MVLWVTVVRADGYHLEQLYRILDTLLSHLQG
jgi:hypothetical protein